MDVTALVEFLIKDNSPLSLGFAGAILAAVVWTLGYTALSKLGWVGNGKILKKLEESEANATALQREITKLKVENAELRALLTAATETLKRIEEELARKNQELDEWVSRIEKIAGLQDRLRKPEPR